MNVTTIGAGNLGRGIGHRLVYQRADGVLPNICFQHLRHTCAMLPLTKGSYPVDSRAPLARHSHNVGLVHLQERFWAMRCSAAYELAERTTRSLVNTHKASQSIAQNVS